MSGDHFGAYGDPPSPMERATRRAIDSAEAEAKRVKQLEQDLAAYKVLCSNKDVIIAHLKSVVGRPLCPVCKTPMCVHADYRNDEEVEYSWDCECSSDDLRNEYNRRRKDAANSTPNLPNM